MTDKGARRIRPLALGLLTLACAQVAFPQAATTTTTTTTTTSPEQTPVLMNEFTVQGSYAGSLEMAAASKQAATGIVEVIAPEDIGKLPDVSIADSLARLPGLTSQRVNGRFQDATIRGLPGDFNVGTLDGVEQATTGGDAGNDSRAV
jgi:iron complex outermembrane recepter protein